MKLFCKLIIRIGTKIVLKLHAVLLLSYFFYLVVSTIPLCICVGTLSGGLLTEKIGNLWNLRVSLLMELIGWIIIYWSQSFDCLLIGRILTGLGAGLSTPSTYLILTDLSLIRLDIFSFIIKVDFEKLTLSPALNYHFCLVKVGL